MFYHFPQGKGIMKSYWLGAKTKKIRLPNRRIKIKKATSVKYKAEHIILEQSEEMDDRLTPDVTNKLLHDLENPGSVHSVRSEVYSSVSYETRDNSCGCSPGRRAKKKSTTPTYCPVHCSHCLENNSNTDLCKQSGSTELLTKAGGNVFKSEFAAPNGMPKKIVSKTSKRNSSLCSLI